MAADEKWYFTKEQLANSPSRKCGIDADKELSNRQQAANFIQDMGQRLVVYAFLYLRCTKLFNCILQISKFCALPFHSLFDLNIFFDLWRSCINIAWKPCHIRATLCENCVPSYLLLSFFHMKRKLVRFL